MWPFDSGTHDVLTHGKSIGVLLLHWTHWIVSGLCQPRQWRGWGHQKDAKGDAAAVADGHRWSHGAVILSYCHLWKIMKISMKQQRERHHQRGSSVKKISEPQKFRLTCLSGSEGNTVESGDSTIERARWADWVGRFLFPNYKVRGVLKRPCHWWWFVQEIIPTFL